MPNRRARRGRAAQQVPEEPIERPNRTLLKEFHADLARRYKRHKTAIECFWRSFDAPQRATLLRATRSDGVVLRHPTDTNLDNMCGMVPECNLRDIAESGPDFFLNLLKHRATTTLFQQYFNGPDGGPGDHAVITKILRTRYLRHGLQYHTCFTLFVDENRYGEAFRITAPPADMLPGPLTRAIAAGICVPESLGELILGRQLGITQLLIMLISGILDQGSKTRAKNEPPAMPDKVASAALAKLTITDEDQSSPPEIVLADLITSTREHKETLDELLNLICTEPVVLTHAVDTRFFTQPELLPDEKGVWLPFFTDRYISGVILETIHIAVQHAAIWDYLCQLLELFDKRATNDELYRTILLQELASLCDLEFTRAQGLSRRHLQAGSGKRFSKRQPDRHDKAGNALVSMNCNMKKLAKTDAQLFYMMRLCSPETTPQEAVDWLTKLVQFYDSDPEASNRAISKEVEGLGELVIITSFIQDLRSVASLPPLSAKRGRLFLSRLQDLNIEVSQLKGQIDLLEFAAPIRNLLEPGMSEAALKKLDQFVVDKLGTKIGFLYGDMVLESLAALEKQYQVAKAKLDEQRAKAATQHREPQMMDWEPTAAPPPQEERIKQRKQKEKTRPAHSSVYDITNPQPPTLDNTKSTSQTPSPEPIPVSSSTAAVFSTFFDRSQSRGSVDWSAFVAAMADLGFSVTPRFGSVYTFTPPALSKQDSKLGSDVKRPLTFHRPHQSRIEGYSLLIFSRRLKRVYGWGEGTFVVA
ncbi:hypothetical protein B0J18DRAFT_488507 [Chaetomium sp. MPI-SDFR-AT-0129]|nr:hypothetical protein B0J18DRAFT_488507 [Chaetomium sp. MPI-SDFR-AT-0129]